MRRLSKAQSEPILAEAREILRLYRRRLESQEAPSARSLLSLIEEMLRLGKYPDASPDPDSLRLTAVQQWLVNITWALKEIGPVSAFVMQARLTRSRVDSSWPRIAGDLERAGVDLKEPEARELFRAAVPMFVYLLRKRGITTATPVRELRRRDEDIPAQLRDAKVTVSQFCRVLRRATAA